MKGNWTPWYGAASEQLAYGDPITYSIAEEWLQGLPVEDWGCGYAWFKTVHNGRYRGLDGTDSKWCDEVVDLREYVSDSPGILLRHVLEHNHDWAKVLDNAVLSFSDRLCIILFTPLQEETRVISKNVCNLGVPDIAFRLDDITDRLGCSFWVSSISSGSAYGCETIINVQK